MRVVFLSFLISLSVLLLGCKTVSENPEITAGAIIEALEYKIKDKTDAQKVEKLGDVVHEIDNLLIVVSDKNSTLEYVYNEAKKEVYESGKMDSSVKLLLFGVLDEAAKRAKRKLKDDPEYSDDIETVKNIFVLIRSAAIKQRAKYI